MLNGVASSLKFFSIKGTASAAKVADQPQTLPTVDIPLIQTDELIEEEKSSDYKPDYFYPVQLGEIFQGRYQVITKLGFGASSTTWLAHDLRDRQYVALKVCVRDSLAHRELPFHHHIAPRLENSPKEQVNIRKLLDSFQVAGPHGTHVVLVFEAAQMSLRDMQSAFLPGGFKEDFVRGAIFELLKILDFCHTYGETIHTDVHPGNMLLGAYDNTIFRTLEEEEFTSPVPRKQDSSGRTIYLSRLMCPREGPMLLSDFGEARIGQGPHSGDIMPLQYRAPETLLYVSWSFLVDIWSVGLTAWNLLEPKLLFTARDDNGNPSDAAHIAQLIAALGPPPAEFLAKNPERKADFWSDQGEWLGLAPIPYARTMEALETRLEDKSGFLRFIRRALTWLPENRATAKELLQDPWLDG